MALDKSRPYGEHDGCQYPDIKYMQDGKNYRADETEILSAAEQAKAAKAEAVKAKTPVEPDASLA
jgi:hypothetical protein